MDKFNSQFAASGATQNRNEMRYLAACLKLLVGSLPATVIFNPIMTVLAASAFVVGPDAFGRVRPVNIATAIAIQCLSSAVAWLVYRADRGRAGDPRAMLRELVVTQVFYAASWGTVCCLFWINGNAVNNVFVSLIMVSVVWAGTFTRSAHKAVFLADTLTLSCMFLLRCLTAPGTVAHVLGGILPLWIVYIVLMGTGARKRVDELLQAQFSNEDLTEALRGARDEALGKRYEAEAANASKTAFLANMSHELRTPLNAILGFSEIIAAQSFGVASERYKEYAGDIHSSGAHLLSLINDLLDVSKIEAGKMEIDSQPIDPETTMGSIRRLMMPRAREKNQTLDLITDPDAPWLVADARAVKQIAFNLVSNAVKFTPKGGHIVVTCRAPKDGGFLITVADNGPGIAEDKLDKIFVPFSQVDNRYDRKEGGTGLGLALVRGLAELHGGRVWIESQVGAGTTVFVYFPLVTTRGRETMRMAL
jgi:two-component system cell cycle sensor histidine kinase PleC